METSNGLHLLNTSTHSKKSDIISLSMWYPSI